MSKTHIRVTTERGGYAMLLPIRDLVVSQNVTSGGCTVFLSTTDIGSEGWSLRESFDEVAAMLGCAVEPEFSAEAARVKVAQLRALADSLERMLVLESEDA